MSAHVQIGQMAGTNSTVRFGLESWAQYYGDAKFLWPGHWDEVCQDKVRMPLSPDIVWYEACERAGILQIVTGRDDQGFLAGYQISVIRPHPHYSTVLCAFEDTFYLDPLYRRGLVGVKLISESLKLLKARGVQRAFFMSNEQKPTGKIFKFLGFKKSHETYNIWLGD